MHFVGEGCFVVTQEGHNLPRSPESGLTTAYIAICNFIGLHLTTCTSDHSINCHLQAGSDHTERQKDGQLGFTAFFLPWVCHQTRLKKISFSVP